MKSKSNESRRKLLKSIAAGSGAVVAGKSLPENWVRPVVDSVVLPAHAQTSPPELTYSCSVVGPATIDTGIIGAAGPFGYEVTNTGTGPLSGGTMNIVGTAGINFTADDPTISDPLAPGENFLVSLTEISTTSCAADAPAVEGTITVEFTSNETSCQQVVDVTCEILI